MYVGSRSQLFFREHIAENMREWESDQLKPHKAMNLAVSLNQMADYFFQEFGSTPAKVLGATDLKGFREALRAKSSEFALAHDVADAHKHLALSRKNRKVTGASQATTGALRWDEAVWDDAKWDSPDEMVITLDDGSKRSFGTVVRQTKALWEELLLAAGLNAT
jgi:hypothetical protein